jgi:excinuclease ABC subunit A
MRRQHSLEPRSFSFNSPYGACEECHGFGSKWTFDLAKDRRFRCRCSMAAGPARALAVQQQLEALARKSRINLSKPFEELSKKARETLMEGAAACPVSSLSDETYQSSSEAHREWLTDYMSPAECPACHGKRLRPPVSPCA